jgi:hypothetical protein
MRVVLKKNGVLRKSKGLNVKPTYSSYKSSSMHDGVIRVALEKIPQSGNALLFLTFENGPDECIVLGPRDSFVVEECV